MSHRQKLEELERKIARQEAAVRDQKARLKKLARDAETRKKILYGVAILALAQELSSDKREQLLARLHKFITRKSDREFLGLPPLPDDRRVCTSGPSN